MALAFEGVQPVGQAVEAGGRKRTAVAVSTSHCVVGDDVYKWVTMCISGSSTYDELCPLEFLLLSALLFLAQC